jgi:hypothetical protein
MGILKFLFGNKTKVEKEVIDPVLGKLVWIEDEKSWKGIFSGVEILLSLENGMSTPSQELKDYAISILKDPNLLEASLSAEKEKYIAKYPKSEREVKALKYSAINFYRYKSKFNRIIAFLEPSENYRAWRIEFGGTKCEGLDFDS